jgi:hypothetical protein
MADPKKETAVLLAASALKGKNSVCYYWLNLLIHHKKVMLSIEIQLRHNGVYKK